MHLIAGYVRIVAILFEIAPNAKAEKAERASGDEPFPALSCFSFRSLCFNWSNTVYCSKEKIKSKPGLFSQINHIRYLKNRHYNLKVKIWDDTIYYLYLNCRVWGQQKRDAKPIKCVIPSALCKGLPEPFGFPKGTCLHPRGSCVQGLHRNKPDSLTLIFKILCMF